MTGMTVKGESLLNRLYLALHLMVDWFLPS